MVKTELDLRGENCPLPIAQTSMAFRKAAPGDIFVVVSDDYDFEANIKLWCANTNNQLTSFVQEGRDFIATITKN